MNMDGKYPWSEEGMVLLRTIQNYIEDCGGRLEMYEMLQHENSLLACNDTVDRMTVKVAKMYGFITAKKMAEVLEISVTRLNRLIIKAKKEGLIENTRQPFFDRSGIKKRFTNEEIDFIKKHHRTMTLTQIGEALGRSIKSVDHLYRRFPEFRVKNQKSK